MVKVGDTVVVRGAQEKHTARDMFIVTEEKEDKVLAQKLLHPLTGKPRLMSKQYETDKKRLVVIRSGDNEKKAKRREEKEKEKVDNEYDPVNKNFWQDEDDSDDDEVMPNEVKRVRAQAAA